MAQSSLNNQESKTTAQSEQQRNLSACSKCDSKQIYAAKTRNSLGTFADRWRNAYCRPAIADVFSTNVAVPSTLKSRRRQEL